MAGTPFFIESVTKALNEYVTAKQVMAIADMVIFLDLPPDESPYRRMEVLGVAPGDRDAFHEHVLAPFFRTLGDATYYRVHNPPVERGGKFDISSLGLTDHEVNAFRKFVAAQGKAIWVELVNPPYIHGFLIVPGPEGEKVYEVLGHPDEGKIVFYPFSVMVVSSKPGLLGVNDYFGGAAKLVAFNQKMGMTADEARNSMVSEPEIAMMAISAFGYSTTVMEETPGRRIEVRLGQNPLVNELRKAKDMDIPDAEGSAQ